MHQKKNNSCVGKIDCVQKTKKNAPIQPKISRKTVTKNPLDFLSTNMNENVKNMEKAIIYARVSSSVERNRQSTDRQVEDLKKYATYAGLEVVQVFDEHISGAKKNDDRPGLQQAKQFCVENNISICLCSELSRLGRSAFETLETIKWFVDKQINLYLQKEQFTLLDAEGKPSTFAPIMLATLATCAQIERENITFRLRSGYDAFRAKHPGEKVVGRPLGSSMTNEQLEEKYARVVRLLKSGQSIRNTAAIANVGISTVQRVKKQLAL